jgi:radical SAM superfamily enzyme YgiQ (UPF0313 family)
MKKVLLVNCNTEKLPYPVPPLGLCLISAYLEDSWDVSIYDCMFDEGVGLMQRVVDFDPDYIGFSIRNIDSTMSDNCTYYIDDLLSRIIHPVLKVTTAKIILGGSGFSIFPQELMELTNADYGIIGEGETAFRKLLIKLDKVESNFPSEQGRLESKANRIIKSNTNHPEILADKFSTIDQRINFSPYRERGAYSIQTKRGCSHGCIYCTYPLLEGKAFRTRDPKDIVDEIDQAHERLGDIMFEFVDSTFNDPKGHAESICREIIRRKIKVRLRTMGINPRNASEELFKFMKEAGFVQIDATPDTASPTLLKSLGKGFSLDEVRQMATTIRKFDLPTMWFFLFGGPGENEDTFKETIDFIDKYINPDDLVYMASGLRIYPNTPLEKIALTENVIQPGQSLLNPPVFYYSKEFSRDRLVQAINNVSTERVNCVTPSETRPPSEMIQEAHKIRIEQNLDEPMFRTLLKIRKGWSKPL